MANKIPVGLQLYTVRDETKVDFIGTLEKVAAMGYRAVEFAGYGDIPYKQMRTVLQNLELQALSSHVGIQLLENELERQLEYSLEIGAGYVVCPHISAESFRDEDKFKRLAEQFQQIGEACRAAGLQFAYHNHAFEFDLMDGETLLDRLYRLVPAEALQAELDLFWVKKGNKDPIAYLQAYQGRVPLIHVKDMTDDAEQTFAEVGSGVIDYTAILPVAEETGVKAFIVEQDKCQRPALESVKMSLDYLKSIGFA